MLASRPEVTRMRRRAMRDGGAGMIEYAGLIVLAALVLAALVSILPGSVSDGVSRAVCQIFQGQNCGPSPSPGRPSAQQPARTNYNVPSRFANGFFHGLGDAFGFSRASIPVDPSTDPGKVWPGAGRPQNDTVDHNIIVYDTKALIEQKKGEYVDDGVVTIDCGPAGHAANCIPGAAKNGKGGDGYADIILTGKDKDTGKPVVYVWEVKTSARQGEATDQLARYIEYKSKQVPPGVEVKYGFGLPTRDGIPGSGNRVLRSWSKGTSTNPANRLRGVRLYNEDDKRRPERQPQEQPAPQPQHDPLVCQPRVPMAGIYSCLTVPGLSQPRLPDADPEPNQAPQPEQPDPGFFPRVFPEPAVG